MNAAETLERRIRYLTCLLIVGLVASGATTIPLQCELDTTARILGVAGSASGPATTGLVKWILKVRDAVRDTDAKYPFIAYGTDWLAFGHFVIAIAFVGALRDPVRNIWLFQFGMIACVLLVPYAFVFGGLRGIPIPWRLIDCSFGVVGFIPLWFCQRSANELAKKHLSSGAPRVVARASTLRSMSALRASCGNAATEDGSRPCESCNRHTGETPVPLPSENQTPGIQR